MPVVHHLSPLTQATRRVYHADRRYTHLYRLFAVWLMMGVPMCSWAQMADDSTANRQPSVNATNHDTTAQSDGSDIAAEPVPTISTPPSPTALPTSDLDNATPATTPPTPIAASHASQPAFVAQIPQTPATPNADTTTHTDKQQASLARLATFYTRDTQASDQAANQTTDTQDRAATTTAQNLTATPAATADTARDNQPTAPMCYGRWVYPDASVTNFSNTNGNSNLTNLAPNQLAAQADYGYYDNADYAELSGNVHIQQGQQQINADKIAVYLSEGIAAAQGNVMLIDGNDAASTTSTEVSSTTRHQARPKTGGLITVADQLAYDINSTQATAHDVAFASVPLQAHGYAKLLNRIDNNHYQIDDAMFTTCDPANPTWRIHAQQIDVDTTSGRGQAYNATLRIKNTPVLYLPYFNFPIDSRRTSGFLIPRAGFSSDGGLQVQAPYYVNLAPNYDATLTPHIYSNRNPMLSGEFRYLTNNFGAGNITGSYLPNDREFDHQDRKSLLFKHQWQSQDNPTLSAEAIYQYVSDSAYLDDFDVLGSQTTQLNLPRRIQANYYNDYLTALAKFETFQTLDNNLTRDQAILDKDKPYYRLPQLSLHYRVPSRYMPWGDWLQVSGTSDFAYFKRPIQDGSAPERSGGRLYNKLTASHSFVRDWGYVTPSVSLQHLYTQYDEESTLANGLDRNNRSQSVFVPELSIDSGLMFYKAGSPTAKLGTGGYQLLSPRLKYVYAPYRDQSDVPNFNTRLASLNFPQLYENTWFLGYDRLADNNHLTPSLNYRYIDGQGLTRLDASIGQQFYFGDIRVHLNNSNEPIHLNTSGTVVQLSAQPRNKLWLDLDGAVTDDGDLGYINTQVRYQPSAANLYNVGYIKRNANPLGQRDLSAVTASVVMPLTFKGFAENWRLLGAVQYDEGRSQWSDVLAGVTYESCCYGFSVYGRRYYDELDDSRKPKRAIMAELSLTGISNRRQGRLASLMNDRVVGFDPNRDF
ncbi:LPS-assembly protein LptD [Faucicola atlantae]|uniref:LPS-assembly protein LptD n=1 Tax=Faucicola atlantae TaxID=34059 RepID=A0A1B8QL57_9GAMM|nr:LPS assembly protein LptD [Moraxella atlantae]OBX84306.1 LPS biosynthesis protein [Moraxella atlantae]